MGNSHHLYIPTTEDKIEKKIKRGDDLHSVLREIQTDDKVGDLLGIVFEPYRWNAIHLAAWYSNREFLQQLLEGNPSVRKFIDVPDINGEPPAAICCVLDDVETLGLLTTIGKCKLDNFRAQEGYRNGLDLTRVCTRHDSVKCFKYLIPNLNEDNEYLDDLYNFARQKNSEKVIEVLEDDRVIDYDSDYDIQGEAQMEEIKL